MKTYKIRLGSVLIITLASISAFGQEFTLTATAANTVSSKSSIDMPGLTGNPLAIIVATPVGNTALLNPHPIGAWYYSGKWNIFNTDHAVMPIGSKYQVQFFAQPGPNQFLHIVTQQNLGSEGSYIDNSALNSNPNVQFKILQNHSPDVRTPYKLNMFEAKAAYSTAAGRWYISNVNGEPLGRNSAYNIVIGSSVATINPTLITTPLDKPARTPTSESPVPNPITGTMRKNSIGMELVYIPSGSFTMGSSANLEKPQHQVTVRDGFWMGRYQVTQGQWQSVMGDNPSGFKDCGGNCPVERVSWHDAKAFINKLNAKNDGFEYSLPSEARWEYAARAGTTSTYGGTGNLDQMGWYYMNSNSTTHSVGQKQPNAWGLYDMHGNVWEWCEDYYGSYSAGVVTDPTGASSGEYRILRGGSWSDEAFFTSSTFRNRYEPSATYDSVGFRVAARAR